MVAQPITHIFGDFRYNNFVFSPAFKQGMEFSSDSEAGPKMGPGGEQTEEEKEAIEAYMAYIENERGMHHTTKQDFPKIFWPKNIFST